LSQFTVLSQNFYQTYDGTTVEVAFGLRRIYVSHLANTYIPTLGLLVIAIVTLQFDETKLEFALGLTLTIMLVMFTMYQSISTTVTNTAYLKWLDYWLFFCLLMPFVVFVIEVFWLLQKNQKLNSNVKGWVNDKSKTTKHHNFCRCFTYATTAVFIFIYILVSVIFYLT
jgi:hypothetical protein